MLRRGRFVVSVSDASPGGEPAAVMYTLIGKLNDVDPPTPSVASPRCRRTDCTTSFLALEG